MIDDQDSADQPVPVSTDQPVPATTERPAAAGLRHGPRTDAADLTPGAGRQTTINEELAGMILVPDTAETRRAEGSAVPADDAPEAEAGPEAEAEADATRTDA